MQQEAKNVAGSSPQSSESSDPDLIGKCLGYLGKEIEVVNILILDNNGHYRELYDRTSRIVRRVKSISDLDKVKKLEEGDLYNTSYSTFKKGYGTLMYRGLWNLFDQIIISPANLNLLQTESWQTIESLIAVNS